MLLDFPAKLPELLRAGLVSHQQQIGHFQGLRRLDQLRHREATVETHALQVFFNVSNKNQAVVKTFKMVVVPFLLVKKMMTFMNIYDRLTYE